MPFNLISFLLGRAILSQEGVDPDRANQLSILTGFLPPMQGLVITAVVGQREAPTPIAQPPITPEKIRVPLVEGKDAIEATRTLVNVGFTNIKCDPGACCTVVKQTPEAGNDVLRDVQIELALRVSTD